MDARRLRVGELVAAVSGLVLVVLLFLPWYTAARPAGAAETNITAWEAYGVMDVVLIVTGLLGVGLLVVTATQRTAAVGIAADALLTVVAGVVAGATLIRVLSVPNLSGSVLDTHRTALAWIGLLASFGVAAGACIAMRDERLSPPGAHTDATGAPVAAPPEIETLAAPPHRIGP